MAKLLEGKSAVITGGGGLIGSEIAIAMAGEGVKLVINDIGARVGDSSLNKGAADKVVAKINQAGGTAIANYDSVADFAAAIENENLYVLTGNGRIHGFVAFYPRGDHLHLENVAVDPEYQGRGDGFRLIEFVEQAARKRGYDRVEAFHQCADDRKPGILPRPRVRSLRARYRGRFRADLFQEGVILKPGPLYF